MSRDDVTQDPGPGSSAADYPGANAPWNSGANAPFAGGTSGTPNGYGGANPSVASPPQAPPGAGAGAGNIGPDITLGPDGNVYGYSRQYDSATNSYSYSYKNLGAATDLNAVSTASGIPVGMLQQAVQQQQSTLNTLAAQGQINPYVGGQMTQQQLTQQLDAVRTAQQYQSAQMMQAVDPRTGYSYAVEQAGYDANNAAFQYQNQGASQQATTYGYQRTNDQGQNYNTNSGVGGMTYGQLGLQNDNSQAQQQYAYGQNYNGANPYTGMSNGQTGLAASNASNAYSLGQNQYNLGTADYTNGQTRQQYSQGTQDLQNQYDRSNSTYQLAHQGNQQSLNTYREGLAGQQAQTQSQSRNLTGVGWAGLTRPSVAGWQ